MAKDSLSKYIKKSTVKSRNIAQRSGSWISNAIKSVGYSTFDVLEELLPATIDVAKVTATTGKDIAESMKKARTSDRSLRTAIDRNYYLGLGREVFKNSLEDLKSGKFYNKERADKFFGDMNDDMMSFDDFDDENFEVGESDEFSSSVDSADGMAHATFSRRKGGNNDVTNVVVGTDLGPDSAIYQATNYQTETMVNVGRAVVDHSNSNARAMITMLGNMRNEFNASLTSISDNVATLSTSLSDTFAKHSALSAKYYEDSISIQTQILESIKAGTGSTQVNTRTFKEYNNVLDMFTTGGAIDPKAYAQLVSKQLNNYIDSNMILSQLKFMAGEKETLKMMAQNPLAFIPKAITKQLIPNTVKSIITEFDNQMKETGIAALNQISGLQRSQNPILSALGKIFGVQNKITISSIDKGAYNKGAAQWTGTDHQALVQVIPTLLRKIHSSVSGSEELVFDYEKGTWTKLRDMERQFERDKVSRETSVYSDYKSDFKEFMDKNLAISKERQDEYYKDFETFLQRLARDSAGGRTFRKGGRSGNETGRDDIRDLMGKGSSDDAAVKIVRAFLEGMEGTDNARLTALFGSKTQEQRAQIDRMMREMQENPTKYNTMYMDTGLGSYNKSGKGRRYGTYTDAHLNYNSDGTRVAGVTGGLMAGVIDKYGHNQTYYLREILQTLNTGIYVVPIGSLGGESGVDTSVQLNNITTRVGDVTTRFGADKNRAKSEEPKQKRSSYTDERRRKDVEAGKLDAEDDFTQDQITALSAGYHRASHDEKSATPSIISKLLGMLPDDTGAAKLLNHTQKGIDNAKDGITSVFKKLDTALFQIVFGDPKGQKGIRALFDKTVGVLKTGFFKFSYFIDDKILKPLNEAMFGENGVFNKIKQTEFWQKTSAAVKDLTSKAGKFFLGEKGPDGTRSGGLFSETANSLSDMGTHVKTAILGEKGPDGKPLPLDQDNSVVGNMKRMFKGVTDSVAKAVGIDTTQPKESFGTKVANGLDKAFNRMSERAKEFSDNIFGEYNGGPEFFKQFKEDLKGQKGFVGASVVVGAAGTMVLSGHMGLLGSMFLPGGPIGGALLGAGIGIISKSNGLKNYLFGPEVTDENGNTFRTGGLITKQVQDFFKENKTGIAIGGFGALASSMGLLPSFFVPGGPIGGALIGGAVSLATKTNEFQRLLYGEGGTKDDPTGGIMKKFKEIFGKRKDMKGLALDAGIGAGVGVVGSFFLPGGPILGALLGSAASVGLASEKFKKWFFGEEGEDGKRKGGVFGKFSDFMKGHIFTPLTNSVKIAQTKIMGFVQENMVLPFKYAIDPLVTEAKHLGGVVKDKITGLFDSVKESFAKHVTRPIGDAIEKHFLSPLKKMLGGFFSGLGKFIGSIITAPVRLVSGAGKAAYGAQKKRGVAAYDAEQMMGMNIFQRMGYRFKNAFTGGSDERKQAAFSDQGAYYERGQDVERYDRLKAEQAKVHADTEAKVAAIRNGTSTNGKIPDNVTKGIPIKVFVERTGLKPTEIFKLIKSGDLPYTKDKQGRYIFDSSLVSRFRRTSGSSGSSSQSTPTPNSGDTSVNVNPAQSSTSDRKNEGAVSETSVNTSSQKQKGQSGVTQTTDNRTSVNSNSPDKVPSVSPVSGSSSQSTPTPNSGDTSVNVNPAQSSTSDRKNEGKGKSSFYDRIQKDVSQIANSVYGQLNGVGSNVNKIYKVLLKKNGLKDEDIKGENNKEYVGFFGRIRTALNRPFQAITDLIVSPFRKISEIGHKFVDRVKGIGSSIKKAGSALVNGVGSLVKGLGKGIGSILKEIVKLPFDIIHTGLSAVRAALPVIGEVAKAGASVLADGIKVAGSVVVNGVKSIGGAISGAAKGFGQMVGGAMSGLGSMLSTMGLIGTDVVKGIWKGAKWLGKGALNVAGTIASAPFKIAGSLFGGSKGGGLFGKKVQHVIVDGGVLDKVKTVNRVKKVGGEELGGKGGSSIRPIRPLPVKPLAGGFGEKDEDKMQVVVAGIQDSVISKIAKAFAIPLNSNGSPDMSGVDNNAGDTAVNAAHTAGGPADDDEDKTDNVGDTSVVTTGMAGLKASWSNFKEKLSGAGSSIREKIEKRQAQVDKGSRTSLLSRFAAADKDKEESEWRKKSLELMGKTAESSTQHKSLFNGIFGKKGLITAGIIALAPFIIKFFKDFKFGSLISSIANTISTGWNEIGGLQGLINNIGEKVDQVKSVVTGEEETYKVEDGKLVYDENGNLVTETNKRNPIGALLTPNKTRVNVETGEWENRKEWTATSGATVNLVGHKVAIPALKGIGAVEGAARKFAGSKAGHAAMSGLKTLGNKISHSTAVTAAYTYADDALKAGVAGAKSFGSKIATTTSKFVDDAIAKGGTSKVIATFITKASEALNFLVSKLASIGSKFGVKLTEGKFGKIIQLITTKLLNPKKLGGFAKKITEFLASLTSKGTVAAGTAFLAEIAFITYGAIDGAVNAGALFEVNPDAVDGKMRAIAAVFKGLMGTTAGSVVDFINALATDILGMNFVKDIASWTYNLLSNEEDEAALKAAQQDFTQGYEDYVEQEYEAYKKGAEEQGQEAMSFEDFKASNLSTTRSEYNSKTNKSLFKRGYDAVTGAWSGIKKGASGVVNWAKDGVNNAWNGIKNFGSGVAEKASNLWNGAKQFGSNVVSGAVNGVKNLGSNIANSKVGKAVSGGFNKAKDLVSSGITTVATKGKEIFTNVGSSMKNIAKDGVDAGKGLMTGWQNVAKAFYNKDNSFLDYFKSEVNPLSEDNMFHGLVGGVLNVSKFVMFPKLLVAGILKKVGTAIVNTVKKVFTGAKAAFTDYSTNVANLNQLAFKGDISGLSAYNVTMSEDNPVSGFTSGMVGISRILHYPIALVAAGGKKVADFFKSVISGAKTAITDYSSNVANLNQIAFSGDMSGLSSYEVKVSENNPVSGFISGMVGLSRIFHYPIALVVAGGKKVVSGVKSVVSGAKTAITDYSSNVADLNQLAFAGDMEGLTNYEVTVSENNPVSGFTSGMVGLSRILHYPIALLVAGGKKVVSGIKSAVTCVKTTAANIISGSTELGGYAINGDIDALHDYQGVDEEGNPVGGFANAVFGMEKFILSPVAYVVNTGRKIAGFVKNAVGTVVDYGSRAKTFVSKLNEYTDPDKSMSGWDGETMASDDSDVVGSVLSTLIKKVMGIYVGIVRTVKGAFDWIGDLKDSAAEMASNAWDGVKEGASNAWDWVSNKVDAAGTAIMNLGRGGKNGGRPLYGGKGGDEELNGMPYYSQNDPKYKNIQYKQTGGFGNGDTIGDSGCGPTAMAMVASKFTGKDYNPVTMAKMAEAGGYSTSVGTTPGYFSAAGNALGIPNQQMYPSADSLQTSLATGHPVILQGASGGYGSGNSPYTTEGHYVTATGLDGNNNVIINDPRGKEYSGAYRMSDVVNDTTGMWSFGGEAGGYGERKPNSRIRRIKDKLGLGGRSGNTTSDYQKWISICKAVKQAYAAKQLGYSQSRYTDITVGGKTIKGRTDCSGYVQTCLKFFGVMPESSNISSANVQNPGDSIMKATGFTPYSWPGWENLKEGDVLGTSGHTEIFAYNNNGQHYVYNCGSNSSCNNPSATVSGHSKYQTIWRCGGAGTSAISSYAVDGASGMTYDTSGGVSSDSSSSSGGFSSFSALLGGLADAAIKPIYKAFGLSTDEPSGSSTSDGSYSGDGSSTGGNSSVTAANVTGSNTAQQAWNFFTSKGYSKHGTAGIMGNMQAESGMYPQRLQGDFTNGYTKSQEYTKATDSGSNNFVHDSKGYGLVQFTYHSLKKQLLDAAKANNKSVGDTGLQLSVVDNMLRTSYPTVYNTIRTASDVKTASDAMLHGYEKPADQSAAVENKRASLGLGFYNTYAGGGKGGVSGGKPIRRAPVVSLDQSLQKKRHVLGGRGGVSQAPMSMQDIMTPERRTVIERNNVIESMDSNNLVQLFKVAVQYLSQIVTNTGDTNSELEALNSKEFGNISQTNTTNNITDNSTKSYGTRQDPKSVSDRSEYAMAKRVAQGLLD